MVSGGSVKGFSHPDFKVKHIGVLLNVDEEGGIGLSYMDVGDEYVPYDMFSRVQAAFRDKLALRGVSIYDKAARRTYIPPEYRRNPAWVRTALDKAFAEHAPDWQVGWINL